MQKKKKNGIFFYLVPVLLLCGMAVFGYLFMKDFLAYKQAGDEYSAIVEAYIQPVQTEDEENVGETAPQYPVLDIDYAALEQENEDFSAVLSIPVLSLQYPIVHSKDNNDYLHTTFEGKRNFAGCVFLDCEASEDYSDRNSMIYGHNMKNGSMFGTLKRFRKEPGLCDSDPYIYLYRADGVRKYRIFSYYLTQEGSSAYNVVSTDEEYDAYVAAALKSSSYQEYDSSAVDFTDRPDLITLSTCAGKSGGSERFVVHASLVGVYPAE